MFGMLSNSIIYNIYHINIICLVIFISINYVNPFRNQGYNSFFYEKDNSKYKLKKLNDGLIRSKWLKEGILNNDIIAKARGEENEEIDPYLLDLFPKGAKYQHNQSQHQNIDDKDIDFDNLKEDDPIFLEMDWPTELGPKASAFARHLQWRRQLADVERLRWQKWAIYKRVQPRESYSYSCDDFIFQNMLKDINTRHSNYMKQGKVANALAWKAITLAYEDDEELQINGTMKAFYAALNRKNYEDVRVLWLPQESSQLILPGFQPVVGYMEIEKFYRSMAKGLKYLGSVSANTVSVNIYGYIAVVRTLETIGVGNSFRVANKRQERLPIQFTNEAVATQSKNILATTVLRKWNQQWRIMSHHATRISNSEYIGNAKFFAPAILKPKPQIADKPNIAIGKDDKFISDPRIVEKSNSIRASLNKMSELTAQILSGGNSDSSEILKQIVDINGRPVASKDQSKTNSLDSESIPKATTSTVDYIDEINNITSKIFINSIVSQMFSESNSINDKKSDNTEILVDDYINFDASVSKQTILALRYLVKVGKLEKVIKDILVMDIIDSVSNDETSLVETSYELLVLKAFPNNDKTQNSSTKKTSVISLSTRLAFKQCLEEFCEHCQSLYQDLAKQSSYSQNIGDDEEDDDDSDNDDDDDVTTQNKNYDGADASWLSNWGYRLQEDLPALNSISEQSVNMKQKAARERISTVQPINLSSTAEPYVSPNPAEDASAVLTQTMSSKSMKAPKSVDTGKSKSKGVAKIASKVSNSTKHKLFKRSKLTSGEDEDSTPPEIDNELGIKVSNDIKSIPLNDNNISKISPTSIQKNINNKKNSGKTGKNSGSITSNAIIDSMMSASNDVRAYTSNNHNLSHNNYMN